MATRPSAHRTAQWGCMSQSAMPITHYDYAESTGTHDEYWHEHTQNPPAGVNSAKLKQHSWKKITLGKKYDNQEPAWFVDEDGPPQARMEHRWGTSYGAHRGDGAPNGEPDFSRARIDPATTQEPAGSTSRVTAKQDQTRIVQSRPGDAWQNQVGRAPKFGGGEAQHGRRAVNCPVDFMQKKAKGLCNYYNEPTDLIAHSDDCDWKHQAKAGGRRTCGFVAAARPWSFEPHDPNEPEPHSKIPGLPDRVFVAVSGEKKLNICGAEDLAKRYGVLSQDLAPSREHVQGNDQKYLSQCQYRPLWDQIDGHGPVRKPSWNESKKVWSLILDDKVVGRFGEQDYKPSGPVRSKSAKSRVKLAEAARSRSMNSAGRRNSEMTRLDRQDLERANKPPVVWQANRPWAEYEDSHVSQISQTSMPQSRPQDDIQKSQSARGSRGSNRANTTPRRDNRYSPSDVAPSDSISQRSMPQRRSQDSTMRRSQSARAPQGTYDLTAPLHRVEIAPSDSISQRSMPQGRSHDRSARRSHSARDVGNHGRGSLRSSREGARTPPRTDNQARMEEAASRSALTLHAVEERQLRGSSRKTRG